MLVCFLNLSKQKPKPFKFNNHLVAHGDFINVVKSVWDLMIPGYTMYSVVTKLKKLKYSLRKLNSKHGNVFEKVQKLREELSKVQEEVINDLENEELRREEVIYHKAFKEAVLDEEKFLIQKSKVQWLKEGDSNTAYFHKVVKSRINRNKVEVVEDMQGNQFVGNEVASQFVKHFEDMLGTDSLVEKIEDSEGLFVNKIPPQQAEFMIRSIEDQEVKEALWSIDDSKSPGS